MAKFALAFILTLTMIGSSSCNQIITNDPVSSLNSLVQDYGFIGFQNPLDETRTGTMLGGSPTSLAYVASYNECFPESAVERRYDRQHFKQSHSYSFKGGFGFTVFGSALFSAGARLESEHVVDIEINGLTIEYMSALDVARWYQDGMDSLCKEFLDEVGYVAQSLITDSMKISIRDKQGLDISLDFANVIDFINLGPDVEFEFVDEYTIEISTPKYIGYHLGRLRLEDEGRSIYRASTVEDNKFVFESIGLFDDDEKLSQKQAVWSDLDEHSIFVE